MDCKEKACTIEAWLKMQQNAHEGDDQLGSK